LSYELGNTPAIADHIAVPDDNFPRFFYIFPHYYTNTTSYFKLIFSALLAMVRLLIIQQQKAIEKDNHSGINLNLISCSYETNMFKKHPRR
jgi:hypothetical protein